MSATPTNEIVTALRASLKEVERLKQENARLIDERHEPIAIVGMSCRYAGGVSSPSELWELIARGGDAISEFPSDRGWDLERLYDPDPDRPGTSYVREGGFLEDAVSFDAAFFGVSPREALAMDPQQRLLLEASWEALESAALDPLSLKRSDTGVFAGVSSQDYFNPARHMPSDLEGYGMTGGPASVVSGRVAYTFGFEGPAVTVDTACSSSLVALHLACQALRAGECSLALAGGVTVLATPMVFTAFSRQRGLSTDGRCRSFCDGADGTGLSEGVGLVALERLSRARAEGHRVLALVRGSAVNQDGASNGLTAPNGPSQQRVIRQALASAGVAAGDVDVVEGHGTGTALGDPIEAQAIIETYGRERSRERPLWLGSLKSNVGHAQAAAGVGGVIKMVMALRHGLLPKTLHAAAPTGQVDWSEGSVALLSETLPWIGEGKPRRAGVSSFGISGTNAHLILEEAPASAIEAEPCDSSAERVEPVVGGEVWPWALSAKGEAALSGQAARLRGHLRGADDLSLAGVGRALVGERAMFDDRAIVLGGDREELLAGLRSLADSRPAGNVLRGRADCAGSIAFVFPGQGSQWAGMAAELLEGSRVFADSMRECEQALDPFVEWSLTGVLREVDGSLLERVEVVQPVLFAVMVSLARLWRACGVNPDFVVGHSQGEIAAACVAGGLSLRDAALVVAARSRALAALAGEGGMVSVACSEAKLASQLEHLDGGVSIAAVNGPSAVVVSGEPAALARLLERCESEGVRARPIPVDYAAHSPQVETVRRELLDACASISPRSSEIPFYSSVTAGALDTAELDAAYWYRNLRETVRFERATDALVRAGSRVFVEVSPHPVLTAAVQETVERSLSGLEDRGEADGEPDARDATVLSGSLRRGEGGARRFLSSLGELWVRGVGVDWEALLGTGKPAEVSLPTYAFQRQRYWIEAGRGDGDPASVGMTSAEHPLLGAAAPIAGEGGWLLTGRLSLDSHPWLADHVAMGSVLLPGTAFLELALSTAARVGCDAVAELVIEAPLVLEEGRAVQLQVAVAEAEESGSRGLSVHSRLEPARADAQEAPADWVLHAVGTLACDAGPAPREQTVIDAEWPPRGAEPVSVEGLYEHLEQIGLEYGPAFRGLRAAWRRDEDVFAEVALAADRTAGGEAFAIDPAMLDAALHALGSSVADEADGALRLPFAWSGARLHASGSRALRVALTPSGEGSVSLSAVDEAGEMVVSVDSLFVRSVSAEQIRGDRATHSDLPCHVEWTPLAREYESVGGEGWVLLEPQSDARVGPALEGIGVSAEPLGVFSDLDGLRGAIGEERAPRVVLARCATLSGLDAGWLGEQRRGEADESRDPGHSEPQGGSERLPLAARDSVQGALRLLQEWLADERFADSLLVLLTQGAVAAAAGERVDGLIDAPIWGLVRSAQTENPGRVGLIDVDGLQESWKALRSAVVSIEDTGEPQLAIRQGIVCTPRLVRGSAGALSPPAGEACWRLAIGRAGTLEDLSLAASPDVADRLEHGQVRVAMAAAGVNFRDVVAALGVVALRDEGDAIGSEGAGIVLEVGPGVDDLASGDRVMGLFTGAFGSQAVTDRRLLVTIPHGWSFAQAAAMPAAFLTAHYGLVGLAAIKAGERVLVHAAAGGVGMAAVQIARRLGAEVFATASPAKWGTLRALGLEEAHIASSRDIEFKSRFLAATAGQGVDVVLNSLTGELLDASLELLGEGGRFIEMGKADIRDAADVERRWSGVAYRAFDLIEAGAARIEQMLGELLELFAQGALEHLPIRAWDVRRAPEAFRFMAQGRHAGKIVLRMPTPAIATQGTILITGGTGGLGSLVAMHLAELHGARSLVLASRHGPQAPGAAELEAALTKLGAQVAIVACDVTDRQELRGLLHSIPGERPLRAVVHAAGALDDCLIASLTPERLAGVMAAKVDAAWNLHELTSELDLDAFVLFSSIAGVVGGPAQASYAAANTFLDALAAHRRAHGLAGVSMAWGHWQQATGLTGHLSEMDLDRMRRSGVASMPSEEGLRLLDKAWADPDALTVPARLDGAALRALARADALAPIMSGLVRARPRSPERDSSSPLVERLRAATEQERRGIALELVRGEVAAVLGHSSPEAIDTQRALKEQGFDSLLAVELRNRLSTATGLRLAATLVFDHPTAALVASHLLEQVDGGSAAAPRPAQVLRPLEEPVAIVGMACRYPGGVRSPRELWQLLASGGDAISQFPSDRGWELERLYDPELSRPGTSYVREGGFLYDAADFDAAFFGISPREALTMDPQQRLLLEASWEAFEDAGIPPDSLRGSQTGVFTGTTSQDYHLRSHAQSPAEEGYVVTGNSASVLSGRVAYVLGLEGPAISIDTACSSSLVALHLAGAALRAGECSLALAGGVAVLSTPLSFTEFSRQRGLARDGRCKSFADAADGTNWGEGVGVVLLERLSDARRLGHEVLAIVRGSAVNQDGASNGLTAPNGPSQQRVINQALASAGLSPQEVDAVEAHGTGTRLGDPIEAQALLATYGKERPEQRPLWLGSIKSNIGHTQAASGVAGVIKTVMALRRELLPKTLHVDRPTGQVDWSTGAVTLLEEAVPWRRNGRPRRAGVSSFGVSGTNAHLILEEAPCEPSGSHESAAEIVSPAESAARRASERQAPGDETTPRDMTERERTESDAGEHEEMKPQGMDSEPQGMDSEPQGMEPEPQGMDSEPQGMDSEPQGMDSEPQGTEPEPEGTDRETGDMSPQPWIVSGRGEAALRAQARRLYDMVEETPKLQVSDIAFSLASSRSAHPDRAVVMGADREELLRGLDALTGGRRAERVIAARAEAPGRLAFLFTGQGAQRVGMGSGLYRAYPSFRQAFDELCECLDESLGCSLRDVIFGADICREDASGLHKEGSDLDQTRLTQTALFALEVALFRLVQGWGLTPDFLIGHSVGELAAAHVSGVLSLQDACLLVAARGRLMGGLPSGGAMLSVRASQEHVEPLLAGLADRVALAAVNGPTSVVISGDEDAVMELARGWDAAGVKTKRLAVSHAFHSPRMDAMLDDFARIAGELSFSEARIPIVSNLTGRGPGNELCSAQYWVDHVRATVRFRDGVRWLREQGVRSFLELGPDGTLTAMARECLADDGDQLPAEDRSGEGLEPAPSLEARASNGSTSARTEQAPEQARQAQTIAVPILRGDRPEAESAVSAVAELWARGAKVDWARMLDLSEARRVALPTYAFQRQRYWIEDSATPYEAARAGADHQPGVLPGDGFWDAVEREDLAGLLETLQVDDERQRSSLDALLPTLAAWRRRSRASSAVSGWRYRVQWKPIAPTSASPLSGTWLAVVPAGFAEDPWILALTGELEGRGVELALVQAAGVEDARTELTRRLRETLAALPEDASVQGVISMLALQERRDPVCAAVPEGLAGTMALAQALADAEVMAPLWLLTRSAVQAALSDVALSPLQAQVWGLGLVIGLEHPQRWGGLVDLPESLDERVLSLLAGTLAGADGEDQLAVRGAGVFARRVVRSARGESVAAKAWSPPAGTVLITGGTGGLGAHVARWLARCGAEHLLLVSRGGGGAPGAKRLRAELAGLGAEVTVAACDVADREQLSELIDSLSGHRRLSMVVHAAAESSQGALDSLTNRDLEQALSAKAQGALNLDALTEGLELSAFVLFSSIAATFGSGQQGPYAAANACLDALATARRARGRPATSVAWGPWDGEGMAARDGAVAALRKRGLECIAPQLATEALQQALQADETLLAVADIDWRVYAPLFTSARARPLIEDLSEVRAALESSGGRGARTGGRELNERLHEASAEERVPLLLELVRAEVAGVLGHVTVEAIDAKRPFKELGFDSLMALELHERLSLVTGLQLPATLVFDQPTPVAVSEYLLAELTGEGSLEGASVEPELLSLERALVRLEDTAERSRVMARLRVLMDALDGADPRGLAGDEGEAATVLERMRTASDDEIFEFIDRQLGSVES
jgi:candicidin polyketide synthase FscB